MDISKYQKIFTKESNKYLKELDDLLIRVEKDILNSDLWREIYGKIHSIKGMARALSLEKITELGHSMEDWCKAFQDGSVQATPPAIQLLFHGIELLSLLVSKMGDISSAEDQRWYNTLISQLQKSPEDFSPRDLPEKVLPSITESFPGMIDYVRVKYSLIEELLGLSQEIMLLEKSIPPLLYKQISAGVKHWIDDYTSRLKGLHFRLAQLRLMSVGDFADLFVKTIRNLAKENGKEVGFEVIGGEIQADITLLDRLREPLIHILRNAISHGIEPPDERARLGKDIEGKIILEARRERDSLILKISDDGRGISRSAIMTYLKKKRSLNDEQISRMSEEEIFDSILNPDFSSASETTDMSGRGIGMNVVAQAIAFLGGTFKIRSEPSKGTAFILRLPVSLSIIHAITFKIGEYTLSIPTSYVESIDREEEISTDGEHFYDLRGLLGVNSNIGKFSHIIKIQSPGQKYGKGVEKPGVGMVVDSIVGNKPMMIMPIGEILAKAKLFSGVGIMENGDISILLDIDSLPEIPN